MGVLVLRGLLSLKFSAALAAKLCIGPSNVFGCKNVLQVVYHHAQFGGARISPAVVAAKNVDFFVCLFVCLFVTRLCARFRHEGVGIQKRF